MLTLSPDGDSVGLDEIRSEDSEQGVLDHSYRLTGEWCLIIFEVDGGAHLAFYTLLRTAGFGCTSEDAWQ